MNFALISKFRIVLFFVNNCGGIHPIALKYVMSVSLIKLMTSQALQGCYLFMGACGRYGNQWVNTSSPAAKLRHENNH